MNYQGHFGNWRFYIVLMCLPFMVLYGLFEVVTIWIIDLIERLSNNLWHVRYFITHTMRDKVMYPFKWHRENRPSHEK